jgi:FkbH-like protein
LCSKNNEVDVKNLFQQNKYPLTWEDFTICKINWIEKSKNIVDIANELNLSQNSIIFIDDNPFELDSVKALTHVDCVFQFENNFKKLNSISNNLIFKKKKILEEDLNKNQYYKIEKFREKDLKKHKNFDDYIKELNLTISLTKNDVLNFSRLSQLTSKTNQFNFNKVVFTENQLKDWINNDNGVFSISLKDKFGDYGLIGLMLLEKVNNKFIVENFLMSCRALGKKVENKFFNEVILVLGKSKLDEIKLKKTSRNMPSQYFAQYLKGNGYTIREIK